MAAALTVQAVVETSANDLGLAWAPAVVQRLCRLGLTVSEAQHAVLDAAGEGLVEARPESGLGRASTAEIALMPRGYGGCELGWLRAL
jgi:hypothetical protein